MLKSHFPVCPKGWTAFGWIFACAIAQSNLKSTGKLVYFTIVLQQLNQWLNRTICILIKTMRYWWVQNIILWIFNWKKTTIFSLERTKNWFPLPYDRTLMKIKIPTKELRSKELFYYSVCGNMEILMIKTYLRWW